MPFLAKGDSAIYQQCDDPDCPDKREGYEHAHVVRVENNSGWQPRKGLVSMNVPPPKSSERTGPPADYDG